MQKLNLLYFFSLLIIICLTEPNQGISQEIVDVEYKGGVGKILVELSLANIGITRPVENDVEVFKIRYTTKDITGGVDTASGLLVLPVFRDKTMPILVYHHGTVGSREDVPSNFSITTQNEAQIALIYGSFGYATLAPDYIGLGDSPGFHPYLHAESEAWSAIDMITAFKKYAAQESIPLNDQLFTCGYSQGGHASMATHMVLQRDYSDTYTVTAGAPMSGPYNFYGNTIDFTLSEQEFDLVAYIAYVELSFQLIYPGYPSLDNLDHFFKPQFVDDILKFRNEEISLWDLNGRLRSKIIAQTGRSIPKFMLQDSIVDIIKNQADHPISQGLIDNNLYDWVPEAPVRMYYCKADEQVFYKNATFTDSIMNANGAQDVKSVNLGDDLNHGGCVFPAIESALDFFNTLRDITSTNAEVNIAEIATIYPNPASSKVFISSIENKILEARIYDLNGTLLKIEYQPGASINLSDLQSGMYVLNIRTEDKIASTKLVVE